MIRSLDIASRGLAVQQMALDVTSNNIANANTPGYSRQNPLMATLTPDRVSGMDMGRGSFLAAVSQSTSSLLQNALSNNGSQLSFLNTLSTGLNSIAGVFGNLDVPGLTTAVDSFFQSWQLLANNPLDQAQRQNVRARATDVVNLVSSMHQQLNDAQLTADTQIDNAITRANTLLNQIASLNGQIQAHEAGGLGAANDLRDQREQAIQDLAKIMPVQRVATKDGSLMLQTPGGDMLVQGSQFVNNLARGTGAPNGFRSIVLTSTGQPVTGIDQGGEIGGLVSLRDNNLASYKQKLNDFSTNLINEVNQLQASGTGSTRASLVTAGQASANPALPLNDPAQGLLLAGQIKTGSFSVHLYDPTGAPVAAGGTTINVTAGVTTLNDIATQLNAIAGVTATIDATGRLSINAGTNTIGFAGDTSNVLSVYEVNSFFHGSSAADLSLSAGIQADPGLIATGKIDPLTSNIPAGDNSTAIAMLALMDKPVSYNGTAQMSLYNRSADIAGSFGVDVSSTSQQQSYRKGEASSLASQREAISGVNVDEEMIAMLKFQRAYEANAKVIQTSNQMLTALMGLIR